jgi:hypothetical protein
MLSLSYEEFLMVLDCFKRFKDRRQGSSGSFKKRASLNLSNCRHNSKCLWNKNEDEKRKSRRCKGVTRKNKYSYPIVVCRLFQVERGPWWHSVAQVCETNDEPSYIVSSNLFTIKRHAQLSHTGIVQLYTEFFFLRTWSLQEMAGHPCWYFPNDPY